MTRFTTPSHFRRPGLWTLHSHDENLRDELRVHEVGILVVATVSTAEVIEILFVYVYDSGILGKPNPCGSNKIVGYHLHTAPYHIPFSLMI